MVMRERDFFAILGGRLGREGLARASSEKSVLLDTSVIIDDGSPTFHGPVLLTAR